MRLMAGVPLLIGLSLLASFARPEFDCLPRFGLQSFVYFAATFSCGFVVALMSARLVR